MPSGSTREPAPSSRRLREQLAWARWAVERWAGFPVNHTPRPLVLVGPREIVRGFRSGDAKLAYLHGRIEASVPVPEPVLAALRNRRIEGGPPPPLTLAITAAALDEAEFTTDRGRRILPAWRVELTDSLGPVWILDPDVAVWAPAEPGPPPPPLDRPPHNHLSAAADGRTLTYSFIGGAPATADYPRAEVVESERALAVVPVERSLVPPGTHVPAIGCERTVEVGLARPLGARVVVNLHGGAVEVHVPEVSARSA